MERVIQQIQAYCPVNEQELCDKEIMIRFLKQNPDACLRENKTAHVTVSGWIVNETRDKVLMCYHKIYDSWSWLGGHADGENRLLHVALKEAKEESGLTDIKPVTGEICSLEILTVNGHIKRGEYVSSHLHLNVTYLLEAKEADLLTGNEEENAGVAWFSLEDALKASTEPWFVEHVYKKLNDRVRELKDSPQ